jgi:hypothetical protein
MGVTLSPASNNPAYNLVDILECHVSTDQVGFVSLPEALAFRVYRNADTGGTGKFGFPARLYFDRWTLDKRELVENVIKAREREIEESVKSMEEESFKLRKFEVGLILLACLGWLVYWVVVGQGYVGGSPGVCQAF